MRDKRAKSKVALDTQKQCDIIHSLRRKRTTKPQNPKVVCKDGFQISVQASVFHYCTPREDVAEYTHVECGFPNMVPGDELKKYAEYAKEDEDYLGTVYGFVPVDVVLRELESHGGILTGKMPD